MKFVMRTRWVFLLALGLLISCKPQAGTLPDFTHMVEKYGPAVVNISTTHKVDTSDDQGDQQLPDILRHFFGDNGGGQFDMPREQETKSLGSGFIISSDGYILTNYHVVKDADQIVVRLKDRREFDAKVKGKDEQSDLALLKVDASDLPTVKIGSSKDLKVGQWVVAIGAPFGFDNTVTAGIVSAKGRSLPNENYVPFIQTDVAINPGNSGGPLFNMDGEVVGINSQIVSRSGGFMGLSFAIPIDMAMDVVKQLKTSGKVSRGWLGVLIQSVNRDLAESFGLDKPEGALVAKVLPHSPAAKAGFKPGDVVLSFNDHKIEVSSDLPHYVGRTPPGTKAQVKILRNGKKKTLDVTIGQLPDDMAQATGGGGPEGQAHTGKASLGMRVAPLDAQERQDLNVDYGVKVTDVEDGPAAKAGIRRGDVIVSLDNQPVKSPSDFHKIAENLPHDAVVPVLVNRNGNPRFLALHAK